MSYITVCPQCRKEYTPILSTNRAGMTLWRGEALIQDAFPNATNAEREQLQTGICSDECWAEIFKDED